MIHFHRASADEKIEAFKAVHSIWPHADDPEVHLLRRLHAIQQARAEWFVGTLEGRVVVSCGAYPLNLFGPKATRPTRGFGAVYTEPRARGQGHAANLLRFVMEEYITQGIDDFILFSDIDPRYYEKIGFRTLPSWAWTIKPLPLPKLSQWSLKTIPVLAYSPGSMNCTFGISRTSDDDVWTLAKQGHRLRKTRVFKQDGECVYWILSHKDVTTYTFLESNIPQDAEHWELFETLIAADCSKARCHRAEGWWTAPQSNAVPSPIIHRRSDGILMWMSGQGDRDPWFTEIQNSGFRAFRSEQF